MRRVLDTLLLLAAAVPEGVVVPMGVCLGWVLGHVLRLRRRVIVTQLRDSFPELDDRQISRLLHEVYRHFGLLFFEMLRLPGMTSEQVLAKVRFDGTEHIAAALAQGKGVLVLTGHIGSWELGLAASAARGYPTHAITKEFKGLAVHVAERMRQAHGVQFIPRRNSLRQIVKVLRSNGCIGFVLDQNMTEDEGVFVEFLGRPACTMPGLAVLARRYHVPVVPAYVRRDADLRCHTATFLPEVEWESVGPDPKADVHHNTQRYSRVMEEVIRERPDQWFWCHRRWKTQPDDAPGELGTEVQNPTDG